MVTMTDEAPQYETREVREVIHGDDRVLERSQTLDMIMGTVGALGGPAAVYGVAKLAKDVAVAKIQANAQVEVARIENGYPQEGGAHRAE